jgi:hypothetical protein
LHADPASVTITVKNGVVVITAPLAATPSVTPESA